MYTNREPPPNGKLRMKPPSTEIVRALRQQLRGIETAEPAASTAPISSGCTTLDRLLPGGGFVPGQLIEWLAAGSGSGAGTLAMIVARQACGHGRGALVVADRARQFYPPAAVAWGIDWQQLIVVRARSEKDELWALDQALRCPGVAAVWASLERLTERAFRRMQLAAESGQGLGLLLRPARVRGKPSWSDAQLLVQPRPSPPPPSGHPATVRVRRLYVEMVRCPGAAATGAVELEIDEKTGTIREIDTMGHAETTNHETHSMYLATQLAHPASDRRSARA